MTTQLLANGRFVTVNPKHYMLLREVVYILKQEGHSVLYEDTLEGGKVVRASAFHYLNCPKCAKPNS